MADVFISYHEDSAGTLAQQIADTLESAGISCWIARRDMPFGGDFAEVIPGQIDSCKVFLLLLNENAPHSRHIRSEIGLAFGRYDKGEDIKILPLKLGKFERKPWIRYFLNQVQIFPFSAQELNQLAARIAQLLNRKPPAPQAEPEPPQLLPSPPTEPEPPQPKIINSGKCGDNVTYTLYENGQLVISGSGPMKDYPWLFFNPPWYPQGETISNVRIQNGVTSIGMFAFDNCISLANVSIPDSVTSIQANAFYGCKSLKSVLIPDSVTSIGAWAFAHCANLTSVSIPAKAKIHSNVFPKHTTVTRRPKKP